MMQGAGRRVNNGSVQARGDAMMTYDEAWAWARARGMAVPRCDSPIVQGWIDRVQLAVSRPEREDYVGECIRYLGSR